MVVRPRLFVHVTWTTLERRAMITPKVVQFLREFLPAEAARHGCETVALGMVCDHVHLALRLPSRFDLSRLLQGLKGASARRVTADLNISAIGLRWAKGYQASTVGPKALSAVVDYVNSQSIRHPDLTIEDRHRPGNSPALQGGSPKAPSRRFSRRNHATPPPRHSSYRVASPPTASLPLAPTIVPSHRAESVARPLRTARQKSPTSRCRHANRRARWPGIAGVSLR